MKLTLEEEVKEYVDNNVFCDGITPFEMGIANMAFIAGANSKWVEAEKIKAQIEAVKATRVYGYHSTLNKLENELKELEK